MRPSTARTLRRSAVVALVLTLVFLAMDKLGLARPLYFGILGALLLLAAFVSYLPFHASAAFEPLHAALRERFWRREAGQFYSFAGVPLQVVDDGRHVWLGAEGLQRVLGRQEADDLVAARHSERWQRHDEHGLLLRVDAVIHVLNTMRGRDDPRVQRFRRFLDRDVLFPASQRRARREGARTGPR